MKFPLPIKLLFIFVMVLLMSTVVFKFYLGYSFFSILIWIIPSGIFLGVIFLFFRRGQLKRKNYHSKFN